MKSLTIPRLLSPSSSSSSLLSRLLLFVALLAAATMTMTMGGHSNGLYTYAMASADADGASTTTTTAADGSTMNDGAAADGDGGAPIVEPFDDSHIVYDNQQHTADLSRRLPTPTAAPINVPCDVLKDGAKIPFAAVKRDLVKLIRDVAQGSLARQKAEEDRRRAEEDQYASAEEMMLRKAGGNSRGSRQQRQAPRLRYDTIRNNFVCPPSFLAELRRLIGLIGKSPEGLHAMSSTVRDMAMSAISGGLERMGTDCAVDVLMLSDQLQQWGAELEVLGAAIDHASEDCTHAWAHFITFIDEDENNLSLPDAQQKLAIPQFRSEKCTFIDEYRECFDVPVPEGVRTDGAADEL